MNDIFSITERIKASRVDVVNARARQREAANELALAETFIIQDQGGYGALGSSDGTRKVNLALILSADNLYKAKKANAEKAQRDFELAEAILEQNLDDRRAFEAENYAKALDVLRGRVDHYGNTPVQAVRHEVDDQVRGEVRDALMDEAPF